MLMKPEQPEPQYKPSDVSLSCDSIVNELYELVEKRNDLDEKIEIKQTFNGINTVTGFFTLFNWFVIDLSNDEEIALQSVDDRINYLKREGNKLDCNIPDIKTEEEIKIEKQEICKDNSECPYPKWDRARLNVPHICCPPTK